MRQPTGAEIAWGTAAVALIIVWIAAEFPGVLPDYVSVPCEDADQADDNDCAPVHVVLWPLWALSRFAEIFADQIIALGTLAIAAFTYTLFRSTNRLWLASERQHVLAEDTAERQLRAYVGVKHACVMLTSPADGTATCYIKLKNFGLTPAYKFRAWVLHRIQALVIEPPFDEASVQDANSILMPSAAVDAIFVVAIPSAVRKEITERKKILYVWGRADYIDAFDEPRYIIYRAAIGGRIKPVEFDNFKGDGWGFSPHKRGGEAN